MKTAISNRAPLKERQALLSEEITLEAINFHRQGYDVSAVKQQMLRRYDDIVSVMDQWWLTEDFYCWIVEYAVRNAERPELLHGGR
ncbi:MAG: hypothetical protein H6822_20490 [Planctomycetaceae bacterium]|nr:hypothetical protein [Planctomycetales bacterium]MCB9924569.1 hypothetical protein [Planctomycetaceae bacterium]